MLFRNTKINISIIISIVKIVAVTSRIEEDENAPLKECDFSISLLNDQSNTLVIDIQNNSRNTINNCIINNHNIYHPVIIFKDHLPDFKTVDKLKELMNTNSTIVLIIDSLNLDILENSKLIFFLDFQRSFFYVIVTLKNNNSNTQCYNKINNDIHSKADKFLNRMWHKYRILNVVVTLPFACPHLYFVYNGKKYTNNELYDRITQYVNVRTVLELSMVTRQDTKFLTEGYPLRAIGFERFPTWVSNECIGIQNYINAAHFNGTDGYCGMDVLTSFDIIKHFKFNLSFPSVRNDSQSYGYVKPDGTVTGSLGCLVRNEVFSFNSRFLVSYDMKKKFSYLHYISQDSVCIVLKTPNIVPLWHFPYDIYDMFLWLLITITLISVGVLTWVMAKISDHNSDLKVVNYIFDSMASGLFGFLYLEKSSNFLSLRGSCLLLSIILLAVYQGHINYVFTTQVRFPCINTIEEVNEADIVIYTSASIKDLLNPPPNERQNEMMRHVLEYKRKSIEHHPFEYIIRYPKTGTLDRKSDAILETFKYYTEDNGSPKLYVVKECLQSYYLAFIARVDFPFLEEITMLQQRLLEAGLPDKYYEWTKRTLLGLTKVVSPNNFLTGGPRPTDKVTMTDNCIAFGLLLMGYVLSMAIFIFEFVWPKKLGTHAYNK